MARNSRLWQDSLAVAISYEGDTVLGGQWLGYAKAQLSHMLQSTAGPLTATYAPTADITIRVDTRPNRIRIIAKGGVSVYIPQALFQIPEDPPYYPVGSHQYWDVIKPTSATALQALFSDPSGFNTVGNTQTSQFTRSTVDKAIKLGTLSPVPVDPVMSPGVDNLYVTDLSKTYGLRGYPDMPINSQWVGTNKLIIQAGLKAFKNVASHSAVLPPGDNRTDNFIPHKFYSGISSGSNLPPLALGVYIDTFFYAFPSLLTLPPIAPIPNGVTGSAPYLTAARPKTDTVLSAVSTSQRTVGSQTGFNNNGGRRATFGIRLGLSTTVTPTIAENVKMSDGLTVSHTLNGSLTPLTYLSVDETQDIGGNSAIIWMEFSPDSHFLYVAMFWTATTVSDISVPFSDVKLVLRRIPVYDGTSMVIGSFTTIATIPIIETTLSNYPTNKVLGAFRCQILDASTHLIGFMRSRIENTSGAIYTADLTFRTYTLHADVLDPTALASTVADVVVESARPVATANSADFYTIPFADYIKRIFVYASNAAEFGTGAQLYFGSSKVAIPYSGAVSLGSQIHSGSIGLTSINYFGYLPLSAARENQLTPKLALMESMFGNFSVVSGGNAFVLCRTLDTTKPNFDAIKYVPAVLKISLVDGSHSVIKLPDDLIPGCITLGK